ncbi:MAG TPA: SRPBCC family protein [Pseudonocardia sp.]
MTFDASTAAQDSRVISFERVIQVPPEKIFALIADPAAQPQWDGNDNLGAAAEGQRVRAVGDTFVTAITTGATRENHVVEFEEGRRIAWRPAEPGRQPPGHLWRWELVPLDDAQTLIRHTYDWTELTDPERFERAKATTAERLQASVDRLATLVGSP